MRKRNLSWLAWVCFGAVTLIVVAGTLVQVRQNTQQNPAFLASGLLLALFTALTAFLAALIISHQQRNAIGWLLMITAAGNALGTPVETYLAGFQVAPQAPSFFFLLLAWFNGWSWALTLFPLFLIPLLFPTGQPPSPRWRWVLYGMLGLISLFFLFSTFETTLSPANSDWTVPNPIGFINFGFPFIPWGIALIGLIILCVLSLFIRYRRASALERAQIRWFLSACALFVLTYTPLFLYFDWSNPDPTLLNIIFELLFVLALLALPTSIAIAILRYRLWDIDVIIRRTLVYGALTATLALVFFGSVVVLQTIFTAVSGEQSAVATVISTLLIAALFTPLRRRIQHDIDRRFFRQKYNAEQAIERFAAAARQETDLDQLTAELLAVVAETMQPESVSLWLRPQERKR
jgi:hypothetical protein